MDSATPFFSIIAPAYNVAGTIRLAIESVLGQSFGDFELIVVDDRSPDISGAIADELAVEDQRVHVIHSDVNQGLGQARNTGMSAASGRYVLFLDTDDWFEDGALAAIHHRIVETEFPEVVIYDYARAYWWGARERNVKGHVLREAGDQPWTLQEHPELLEVLNVAWNKAYSREFLNRTGLTFPAGLYEDIPWTYPVLMEAQTIATVDFVAVGYRQSRGGSILKSSSSKHLSVVGQWDAVMAFIDANPEHERWREPLYERLAHHLVNLAGNSSGRIPADSWNDFIVDVGRCLAEHLPPGYNFSGRSVAMRAEVLMRGNPAAFRALKAVNGARIMLRNTAQKRAGKTRKRAKQLRSDGFLKVHEAACALPVDENLAIFASYWCKQFAGNPRAIYEEMQARPGAPRCVWIFQNVPPLDFPPDGEFVRKGTRDYYWLLGRAKFLINNVNFADFVVRRPGAIHLQTQHGTPLKSMGLDLRHYPQAAKGMSFKKLLRRCDRWDLNLSSNRYSTEVWERAFPCDFESFEAGYPRNDVLVNNAENAEARNDARRRLGVPTTGRVLLYMPTFRDYDDDFQVDIDLNALAKNLGSDWTVIVRAHYFYNSASIDSASAREERANLIDISHHAVVEDAYLASDVLLTDYSSAMFDFANLGRPIVLYVPDWDRYRAERGLYFDVRETPPGPIAATEAELTAIMASKRFDSEESLARLARFRELFCEFDDGRAAARVVDGLFGIDEPTAVISSVDLSELTMYPTANWMEPNEHLRAT